MWRVIKGLGMAFLVLVATLAAAAAGTALWLERSVADPDGRRAVPGLHADSEILADSHGVPHIFSADRHDVFFALGWLHASERLFQMDFARRAGRGALAAAIGASGLANDRYVRTLGVARVAEAEYQAASPALKAVLDAYADGVNAWLAVRDRPLPPEYTLLMLEPGPWRGADSLVVAKMMALMLTGNWQREAARAALLKTLPAAAAAFLMPLESGGPAGDGVGRLSPFGPLGQGASNAWAVAGRRTVTGKPILASDPHLGLQAPGLWYLAHLSAPDLDAAGATLPGIPLIVIGHNGHVAWGLTTLFGDVSDLFLETLDRSDAGRYLTPQGSHPFAIRSEDIAVRFGAAERLVIRTTRHGPVVSDLGAPGLPLTSAPGTVLALAHAALMPGDRTAEAMLGFLDAGDSAAFVAAAHDFDAPMQVLTFADTQGHIGHIGAGRVPQRAGGNGLLPADGADGKADWIGWVPFDGLPRTIDPASGRVLHANNALTDRNTPWSIGQDFDAPDRAERLATLLARPQPYDLDQASADQMDAWSPAAARLIPRLIAAVGPADGRAGAAVARLAAWDFTMRGDAAEPLLAMAWIRALDRRLFADELGQAYRFYAGLHAPQIAAVLDGAADWCDDRTTPAMEDCAGRIRLALDDALDDLARRYGDDLARWRWDVAHYARQRHGLFELVPGLGLLTRIDVPSAGGDDSLLRGATRFASADAPFANRHAAGLRFVFDLADLGRSRYIIATGQSGNPYSPWYRDLAPLWAAGRQVPMPLARTAVETIAAHRLVLEPAAQSGE